MQDADRIFLIPPAWLRKSIQPNFPIAIGDFGLIIDGRHALPHNNSAVARSGRLETLLVP